MSTEPKREPEVLNPRYAGATPQDVARALWNKKMPDDESGTASPVMPCRVPVSEPSLES